MFPLLLIIFLCNVTQCISSWNIAFLNPFAESSYLCLYLEVFSLFSIGSFITLGLILRSLIPFESIFVQGLRYGSNFKPQQMEIHFSSPIHWRGFSVFPSLFSKLIVTNSHCHLGCIGNHLGIKTVFPKESKTKKESSLWLWAAPFYRLRSQTKWEDLCLWTQCHQLPHVSVVMAALPWQTVHSSCEPK